MLIKFEGNLVKDNFHVTAKFGGKAFTERKLKQYYRKAPRACHCTPKGTRALRRVPHTASVQVRSLLLRQDEISRLSYKCLKNLVTKHSQK